jgi:hypothetical protein
MSKMDDLRAMREARYAQQTSRGTKPSPVPRAAVEPTPKAAEARSPAADPEPTESLLCGHRAISGRTCTREQGHAAKSHRYS